MKIKISLIFLFCITAISAQRTGATSQSKEWSKNGSLFGAKSFIFQEILGSSDEVAKFSVLPLAAASSDELTTVFYNSAELKKSGVVFCFYGKYWNNSGTSFNGYAYKDLPKDKALFLLGKIENTIEENKKFLKDEKNINNIFFDFEDMQILIYHDGGIKMRIYWKEFDSTWEQNAFYWTKKRFERELD